MTVIREESSVSMVIGIDARFFGPKGKGLGRYTQKLIETLEKIDSQNQYAVFLRRENFDDYQPAAKNFRKVLADYRWYSLKEQIFMPFLIRRTKVDLMHFPHFNVPVFYFGKFVVTIHDLILRRFLTRRASTLGPILWGLKNLAYRLVIWTAIKKAAKVITVSNYVKKEIVYFFKIRPEKIAVIYEGRPTKNSEQKTQNPKSNFKRRDITGHYLLYVGSAYPHKNLNNLIDAFNILVSRDKFSLQLVFVGEQDYFYRQLGNYLAEYFIYLENRIIFTDFVSDSELEDIYRGALVYVFPSLCEGFGLPPLEAMTYGVPVVSSNATCLPEILGQAAIYFEPKDPQDMAEKIKRVIKNKKIRQELVANGFKQIKKYSWDKMGKATLKIYKEIGQK